MADALSGMSMSNYGKQTQMWGMGSQMDTQSLVEMEFSMLELKNSPIKTQKGYFTQERDFWLDLKTYVSEFQAATKKLGELQDANKTVSASSEGYATFSADKTAAEVSYSLEVQNVATAHKIMSDSHGSATEALGKIGTVLINGKELEFTEDMTLNDLSAKINKGDFGVNASVISGTLVMTSKETGIENKIQFTDSVAGGILEQLGILNSSAEAKNVVQEAKDAKFKIDGVSVTSANNKVADVVTGVTINLIKETTAPITVKVNKNDAAIKETVEAFVKSYNKTMQRINQHTSEGNVLQGKSIANNTKNDMISALRQPTDSSLMLYQIGIELDGVLNDGTIRFDSKKLDEQLANNYGQVHELLVGENGFAKGLFSKMDAITKENGTLDTKIEGLKRTIKGLDDTLARNEVLFERQRETILRKYAVFETMMANLNMQNQFMTAQIDAMNSKE